MRSAYGAKENEIGQHAATIVVDVANVMGSRPDGWWRDRAGAAVRLHAELTALATSGRAILPDPNGPDGDDGDDGDDGPDGDDGEEEFVMVLEGAARPAAARIAAEGGPGRVRVVLAGGSGDDAIVDLVRELPGRRFVVTADRELQRRCVAAGAGILRPGWLISQLGKQ